MKSIRLILSVAVVTLVSTSCQTLVEKWSPDGGTPTAPVKFKHGGSAGKSGPASSGEWWKDFNDPVLTDLMKAVEMSNPDVGAAIARVDQAYALLGITGAQRFPVVSGDTSYKSLRDSPNTLRFPIDEVEFDQYRLAVNASWELDLWGRVRGAYQREKFNAEAAKAEFENVLLSFRATAARQYFALQFAKRDAEILADAVDTRKEALRLQNALSDRGAGTDVDVARAQTELDSTLVELQGLERTAGKLENSIAILAGRAPSEFHVSSSSEFRVPRIPAGIPTDLLARRPDLRAAENKLLAASRDAGIAKTNFLPRLTLTGTGGVASLKASNLFAGKDSFFFSLGPQLDIPIFQAGSVGSANERARAAWEEAAENYRSVLLTAVREVEDSLLDLQVLSKQSATQTRATDAAAKATGLATKRFDRGAASYFEVIDAQRTELQTRRNANILKSEQAAATVQLIQALGGQW
ncbi:MAG: efflux transporter outer membrane subunit [Verrucomicrobiales bacterium]|nr:efflux transporter outer membrane subunit [Verrucomicrobiales bacterium]